MDASITIEPVTATRQNNITRVINTYSRRLLGFIRKRVDTEADAEDILQDVFFQFTGNTQPIEQVTAWLFTVARNKITDNKRKQRPRLMDDEEGAALFSEGPENPETSFLRTVFWEEFQRALAELPEEQRQAFVLHEMEGISFKKMAEQTGETVNTLISRKRYAVLHLRGKLAKLRDEMLNR